MTNITKALILIVFLIFLQAIEGSSQQLPQFSQYMFNGLHVNPGYAGYKNEGYVQSTYRNQWVDIVGAPQTVSVSADFSANEGRMGFGVSFLNDKVGPTESKIALLTYAYRIQLRPGSFLGLGVSAGLSDYTLDPSLLEMNDLDDPLIPEGLVRKSVPNLNAGLFYHNSKYFAGLSAFNMVGKSSLLAKDVALAYHDFHYYLTAGALYRITDEVDFKPSFLIKHTKGSPTSVDLNGMFLLSKKVWIGGAFRTNARVFKDDIQARADLNKRTALVGLFEVFVTNNFRLGYAYDHNMNALNNLRASSHEFSLGYYLRHKTTVMKNPRWF
jgi:type IX secretion system PorP/SprF family membrane protein